MANPLSQPMSWEGWQRYLQNIDAIKRFGLISPNISYNDHPTMGGERLGRPDDATYGPAGLVGQRRPSPNMVPPVAPGINLGQQPGSIVSNPFNQPPAGATNPMIGPGIPPDNELPVGPNENVTNPTQSPFITTPLAQASAPTGPSAAAPPNVLPNPAGSQVKPEFGGLNNPGNIRTTKDPWVGKVPTIEGQQFENFEDPSFGYRAMVKNMQSYQKSGITTVGDMVDRWLGGVSDSKNNPAAYKSVIEREAGLKPGDPIPFGDPDKMNSLLRSMTIVEKGADLYGETARLRGIELAGAAAPVGSATSTQTPPPAKVGGGGGGSTPVGAASGPTTDVTIPVGGAEPTTGTTPSKEPVTMGRRDTVGGVPSNEAVRKGFGQFAEDMAPAFFKAAGGFFTPGPGALGKGFGQFGEGMSDVQQQQLRERQVANQEVLQKAQIDHIKAQIANGKYINLGHGILFDPATKQTHKIPDVLAAEIDLMDRRISGQLDVALARAGLGGSQFERVQLMTPDGQIVQGMFNKREGKYTLSDGTPMPQGYRAVGVGAGADVKADEEAGKAASKALTAARSSYSDLAGRLETYKRIESTLPTSGAGTTIWNDAQRLISRRLGIDLGSVNLKDLDEARTFFGSLKARGADILKGQGQVSNFERQMVMEGLTLLENDPRNVKGALQKLRLADEYAKQRHEAWLDLPDDQRRPSRYLDWQDKYDREHRDEWSKKLYEGNPTGIQRSAPAPEGAGVTPGGYRFRKVQ